jgi:hypothetical protein
LAPPFSSVATQRPPVPRRARRSRSAVPPSVARVPSPNRRRAASDSRASCANRTATGRGRTGPPSSTTRVKAPERRRRSAHQGARVGSGGRTTQIASSVPAQSRGSRVRVASIHATPNPARNVPRTSARARVVFPSPAGASHSLIRPRGIPPPGSAASRAATPVGSPGLALGVPATTEAIWRRSAASDIPNRTRRREG